MPPPTPPLCVSYISHCCHLPNGNVSQPLPSSSKKSTIGTHTHKKPGWGGFCTASAYSTMPILICKFLTCWGRSSLQAMRTLFCRMTPTFDSWVTHGERVQVALEAPLYQGGHFWNNLCTTNLEWAMELIFHWISCTKSMTWPRIRISHRCLFSTLPHCPWSPFCRVPILLVEGDLIGWRGTAYRCEQQ